MAASGGKEAEVMSPSLREGGLGGWYGKAGTGSQRLGSPLKNYMDDPQFGDKIRYFRALIKETNRAPLVSARA